MPPRKVSVRSPEGWTLQARHGGDSQPFRRDRIAGASMSAPIPSEGALAHNHGPRRRWPGELVLSPERERA